MKSIKFQRRCSSGTEFYEMPLEEGNYGIVYNGGPTLGIKFFSDDGTECLYVELPKEAADKMAQYIIDSDRNHQLYKNLKEI
ncbi:hypothetical protein H1O16_gp220 [Burkholderia phage BcepSaruman]|uniref:Uncharacterized protein n=1 Tax=Burkholderia phage BcepSaruman TaxID=2530032 RepID=A0A4D5ZC83_9CAUD|nr:hypothetical protein H1O16_gp220 [Burkholderia phage BcepSaruman]QBX06633.1 hypothetical protein BcepSaruman_220 [Burkholderia phage BcepSaruman]